MVMRNHLSSNLHMEKFDLYQKEPWRLPFAKTPLEYHQLARLIKASKNENRKEKRKKKKASAKLPSSKMNCTSSSGVGFLSLSSSMSSSTASNVNDVAASSCIVIKQDPSEYEMVEIR